MNRHFKRVVISISVSFVINSIFFMSSMAPISPKVSKMDRIIMWLTTPVERITDWVIPGHVTLAQIILMFTLSLIFYTIIAFVFLELWAFTYKKRIQRKPSDSPLRNSQIHL
jgi:hypothetical protein